MRVFLILRVKKAKSGALHFIVFAKWEGFVAIYSGVFY